MPVALPLAIAGAGIAGGAISAGAAKSAANTQAQAAQRATDTQLQMYNQTRSDLAPYREFGSSFLPGLQKLLGNGSTVTAGAPDWSTYLQNNPDVQARANQLVNSGVVGPNGQWATPEDWAAFQYSNTGKSEGRQLPMFTADQATSSANGVQQALEALPGYQFARDQGVASINRALGSMGQTGAQAKGIARFVTGLADQTYGEQVNRQMAAAQLGQNAAAQTGSIGANYSGNVANTIVGQGTAQAAGTVGAANAISGGLGSVSSAVLLNKILGSGGGGGSVGQYGGAGGRGFDPAIPGT